MRKKVCVAFFLAAAMMMGALAGCSSGKGSTAPETATGVESDKTELKFYIWSDEESYMKEVVNRYNQSQDENVVEIVSIPNDQYDDKLKILLSAGNDADIVDIRTLDQLSRFKDVGAVLDITDMVKNSDLDISQYGSMWDSQYPDGVVTALPTRSTCWMLFYNEDLLAEAGLTMPEQLTWDEYAEMAKQLTNEAEGKYGGYWINWGTYTMYATQKECYLNGDDLSELKNSLELINRFMNEDKSHVPLAEVQATNAQYLADFENEKVAMAPQGEWFINMILEDVKAGKTDINWNVAPLPVPDGVAAGTTIGQFQFAGIPKDAKNPEASFGFLKYLCGEGGSTVLPEFGMLPAYSGDEAKETFAEAVGKQSVVDVVFSAKKVLETPAYEKYNELLAAFKENAELYILGEKDIDTTMDNFEKQRQEIMAN